MWQGSQSLQPSRSDRVESSSMKSMCSCVIWSKIAVFAAAGVMQLTETSCEGEFLAERFGQCDEPCLRRGNVPARSGLLPPAMDAILTMRP
jgi:hypothetical protein